MFCVNCGTKLDSDAKFCVSCGTAKVAAPLVDAPLADAQPAPQMSAQPGSSVQMPSVPPQAPQAAPPVAGEAMPRWIPITTGAIVLVTIIAVILIATLSGSNGYEYVADTDNGIDGSIGEQPIVEHQAGELRKSDIPSEQDFLEVLPEGSIGHDGSNDWLDWELIRFEYYDGGHFAVIMYSEITNIYDWGIDLLDIEVYINDVYTGMFVFLRRIERDSSRQDSILFWESESPIGIGDTITIKATVYVNDNDEQGRFMYEEIGHVEFSFAVSDIVEPGSSVTNPEHISGHEDLSLVITDIELENWAGEATDRPQIEFVITNPTDYQAVFDETEVFVNGVQLTEDEALALFLFAGPDSARRGSLFFDGVYLELGDTITIRSRLQLFWGSIVVTDEIVEFTFVL